ncbi:cytidine/deoxycytidylate deaminase family protein [Cordyceps fumosorosea ARSEF 2679]|uniref:Cytidine/deoxycytidylate deaminase family protein n=1 Tax=Cordyceps fumosorosea (strain ARSEF 2679) TaxID=1081104 RepID=A0A162MUH7_CORFA|nr:cytidine/deoxycytidylate deaminase family protein [Cordyceps fumosorosea ARSEF 2679]OAA70659.1 cytidine/deoxycytidylate deaminase family protein [Cordyceps fumosorosea ARSEF 2679]
MSSSSKDTLSTLLRVIENDIIPLTQAGVASGSKVFGAAILSRETLAPLTVATNDERASPLLHGEINCIQQFFTQDYPDPATRPDPRTDCVFLATHEPCSLCLSGIAWSGFREFYYLFTYEDSRDLFAIPHDIDILQQVFRVPGTEAPEQVERRALYNRENNFFTGRSFLSLVEELGAGKEEREYWLSEIERVKGLYNALSETYQKGKQAGAQTSSAWK